MNGLIDDLGARPGTFEMYDLDINSGVALETEEGISDPVGNILVAAESVVDQALDSLRWAMS